MAGPRYSAVAATQRFKRALRAVVPEAPVGSAEHVLNPLSYAWGLHRQFLERYGPGGAGEVEAVLVGMNPGPWGMGQTGVPFGCPSVVRGFLGLEGRVRAPGGTHPKRPVLGLESPRTEVSGQRLWGGVEACFGTAEAFFARFFVVNYCPLLFQSERGSNVTPDALPAEVMAPCFAVCDAFLGEVLERLRPQTVIGVGRWAEAQARRVAPAGVRVGSILHPSPASPAANRGWLPVARRQLAELGHAWPAPR